MTRGLDRVAVDRAELAALRDFQLAAAESEGGEPVELVEIAGSVCTVMPSHPQSSLGNRVVGLGMAQPATDAVLDAVEAFYARHRASFTIAADLPQLAERGYEALTPWTRFVCDVGAADTPAAAPAVVAVGPGERQEFGVACASSSGAPSYLGPWVAALVGRSGWHCFAVLSRDAIVATAALYVCEDIGWLGFAATEIAHRGRGAQTALLAARIACARERGVSTLVADVAADPASPPTSSHRNIVRAGFRAESVRPNWRGPAVQPRASGPATGS